MDLFAFGARYGFALEYYPEAMPNGDPRMVTVFRGPLQINGVRSSDELPASLYGALRLLRIAWHTMIRSETAAKMAQLDLDSLKQDKESITWLLRSRSKKAAHTRRCHRVENDMAAAQARFKDLEDSLPAVIMLVSLLDSGVIEPEVFDDAIDKLELPLDEVIKVATYVPSEEDGPMWVEDVTVSDSSVDAQPPTSDDA